MADTCKTPGCGKSAISKGYCKQHYNRFLARPKYREQKKEEIEQKKQEEVKEIVRQDNVKSKYTREQLEKIFLTPCKTERDLKNFVKYFFKLHLPDNIVSRYADSDPFHALWEMYQLTVLDDNPNNINELIYVASRGSGKCCIKDTIVVTKESPKYIQDIKVGDLVWTGWSWQLVKETFDEGIKDGITIETETGQLTGSLKHRIQAMDINTGKIDWVYLTDLIVGQIVLRQDNNFKPYLECIKTITFQQSYFYDLEVENDHSYWSNGFISHNTLSVSLAQLLAVIHGKRDVVHVGAIQSQAKRAYEYIQKYLLADSIKDIVSPPKAPDDQRILKKSTMEKTTLGIGGDSYTIEILPCTLKACLMNDSKILTQNGNMEIQNIKKDDTILSVNGPITVLSNDNDYEECIEVEFDNGITIKGTCDHRIWTNEGWIKLNDLTERHEIITMESPK